MLLLAARSLARGRVELVVELESSPRSLWSSGLPGRWVYGILNFCGYRCLATVSAGGIITSLTKFEKLWLDLIADPGQWWDNRIEKPNSRFPDFKHKRTGQALWVVDGRNPSWVARKIPSLLPGRSVFSRANRLSGYNRAGEYEKTMALYEWMQQDGMKIDEYEFIHVLNACAGLRILKEGKLVHERIIAAGCEADPYISTCLVEMYGKCGSIEDAWEVFERMPSRNVGAWNAMILGCVQSKQEQKALELGQQMLEKGVQPNSVTFVNLLNACARVAALDEGRRVHQQIIHSGFEGNGHVCSSLIDMYGKCGSIAEARKVFNKVPTRDVVTWTALIIGCVKCGEELQALELFVQMQKVGIEPNSVSFIGALNACASIVAIEEGRRIHEQIVRTGLESDVRVSSSLVDMYAKCGCMNEARRMFDKMSTRNVVAWTAMILGYVKCGQGMQALDLYQQMELGGVRADPMCFVGLLNACADTAALEDGKRIHKHIIRSGFESDNFVGNSLVDMYAKCGTIDEALRVFNKIPRRDVVAWTALIQGCVKCGQAPRALELYEKMQLEGVLPDAITFVGLLNACGSIGALDEGRRIHNKIIQIGFDSDKYLGNSIVNMYANCGSIEEAWRTFKKMPTRTTVA